MADQQIEDLSTLTALSSGDQFVVNDISDTTDDAGGSPKKVLYDNLGHDISIFTGRLTLATGHYVYAPQPKTPSSTDTGTEVCTFAAAHGWTTGTMVTPASTIGGLTAGTTYFVNALSTTTCAFYTTLANAEADSSRVNLTASITAEIRPFGVQSTTIRLTGPNGGKVRTWLFDGTAWKFFAFSELSLALGTLTSGKNYDVWIYDNAGTPTLELGAGWTDDTTRSTALADQDGVISKTGALTRRLVGTIRTNSTTSSCVIFFGEDKAAQVFVWNANNRMPAVVSITDTTDSWTYSTASWRQRRASANNQIELLNGLSVGGVSLAGISGSYSSGSAVSRYTGIGYDSSTEPTGFTDLAQRDSAASVWHQSFASLTPGLGYHKYCQLEYGNAGATVTWYGDGGSPTVNRTGMSALLSW